MVGALKIAARILFEITQIDTKNIAEINIERDEKGSKPKNDKAVAAKTRKIR